MRPLLRSRGLDSEPPDTASATCLSDPTMDPVSARTVVSHPWGAGPSCSPECPLDTRAWCLSSLRRPTIAADARSSTSGGPSTARRSSPARVWIVIVALAIALPAWIQSDAKAADVNERRAGQGHIDQSRTPPRRSKRADPSDWSDWRNYRPSIAGGFGVTFDHVDSKFDGVTRVAAGGQFPECTFFPDVSRNRATCITSAARPAGSSRVAPSTWRVD